MEYVEAPPPSRNCPKEAQIRENKITSKLLELGLTPLSESVQKEGVFFWKTSLSQDGSRMSPTVKNIYMINHLDQVENVLFENSLR